MKSENFPVFIILLVFALFNFSACSQSENEYDSVYTTDVLIVGGGTSGSSAAIQAARDGADVILVEPSPWLGGMLTAAGVSAVDGNHNLPSGIYGEFRQLIRDYYGGADSIATGWVSHTLFEPHVGNKLLNSMMDDLPEITRLHGFYIDEALMNGNRVDGATFYNEDGETLKVKSEISIDATEYGDLMARSGTDYFLGLDPRKRTGEDIAPTHGNNMIQDLTYTAILKDYGPDADRTIPRPPNYQPSIFEDACRELSANPDEFEGVSCDDMLNYARLPNNKFLINWPNEGNDYYLNVIEMGHHERKILYEEAKNRTRQFIYFIQTEGGYSHLGFADNEFSTDDLFPYIPYHRETRRLDGLTMLTMNELLDPYAADNDLYKTAIAVGDYPLDHHRVLNPSPDDSLLEDGDREPFEFETHFDAFPPIPSFSVPLGTLIPKQTNGLIVAEKSISVSSIANGSSRLQPVVMSIGQAAGIAAAMTVQQNIEPRDLNVRDIQQHLLNQNGWALPFMDTVPDDWHFQPLQRIGLSGVLKGDGVPYEWANQTFIYPDSMMTYREVSEALMIASGNETENILTESSETATHADVIQAVWEMVGSPEPETTGGLNTGTEAHPSAVAIAYAFESGWTDSWIEIEFFNPDDPIRRKEFAAIADRALDPFNSIEIAIVPEKYSR